MSNLYLKLYKCESDSEYYPTDEQRELIEELASSQTSVDVCEMLVEKAPSDIDVHKLGMYVSMLGWETDIVCKQSSQAVERWLKGTDKFRISVALSKEIEWYPFIEKTEMEKGSKSARGAKTAEIRKLREKSRQWRSKISGCRSSES